MSARGGRPRTFDAALAPLAVERRERTGEPWAKIARDLRVPAGTLQARASDYRRGVGAYKSPAEPSDTPDPTPRPSGGPSTPAEEAR
jgi:hypothetical protein